MKEKFILNLFRPLIERIGTMIAAYLIATGADSELVAQVANGLVAAVFLLPDLVISKWFRQRDIAAVIDRESHLWPFRRDDV